jgi:hypothetical protein
MMRLWVLALAGALTAACTAQAAERATRNAEPAKPSMRFAWHSELPPESCGDSCRRWISAVGPITDNTPRDFEAFAKQENVRGATMVLASVGGSVAAALELGRTIRRLEMNTTVGRTVITGSGEQGSATISPDASCSSMCVFLLLSGVKRHVPAVARVNVHQIWITKKLKAIRTSSYQAEDIAIIQRDIGKLVRYTAEMGGDAELVEIALGVPAWGEMYRLTGDELRRVRLDTADNLFGPDVPPVAAAKQGAPMVNSTATSAADGTRN